ncbi:MAG: hypothetical protein ABL921_20195 [Pirellula sp.]
MLEYPGIVQKAFADAGHDDFVVKILQDATHVRDISLRSPAVSNPFAIKVSTTSFLIGLKRESPMLDETTVLAAPYSLAGG